MHSQGRLLHNLVFLVPKLLLGNGLFIESSCFLNDLPP